MQQQKQIDILKTCLSKVNWFGVAGGILTFIVIIVSLNNPWWQLTIGEGAVKINVSPVNTNFGLFGVNFTIPLLYALNIGSILTFLCSGIIMLIYSIAPTKPYAKDLLNFAWKKPLYSIISSTIFLTLSIIIVRTILGMDIPLIGTSTATLPPQFTTGVTINFIATATFKWPLYLAITAALLSIAAKIYHKKTQPTQPTTNNNKHLTPHYNTNFKG